MNSSARQTFRKQSKGWRRCWVLYYMGGGAKIMAYKWAVFQRGTRHIILERGWSKRSESFECQNSDHRAGGLDHRSPSLPCSCRCGNHRTADADVRRSFQSEVTGHHPHTTADVGKLKVESAWLRPWKESTRTLLYTRLICSFVDILSKYHGRSKYWRFILEPNGQFLQNFFWQWCFLCNAGVRFAMVDCHLLLEDKGWFSYRSTVGKYWRVPAAAPRCCVPNKKVALAIAAAWVTSFQVRKGQVHYRTGDF